MSEEKDLIQDAMVLNDSVKWLECRMRAINNRMAEINDLSQTFLGADEQDELDKENLKLMQELSNMLGRCQMELEKLDNMEKKLEELLKRKRE